MEIYLDLTAQEAAIAAWGLRLCMKEVQSDPATQSALNKVLAALASASNDAGRRAERHAGYIDWTLEDDSFEPNGRQFDIRVFYDWVDRDPGNSVTPSFGGYAQVADVEILGVRYYDAQDNLISPVEQHVEAAWKLLAKESPRIEDACTQAGRFADIDVSRPAFPRASTQRLAPSVCRRSAEDQRRASG